MQYDCIVPEMIKFQFLKSWHGLIYVGVDFKNAERKHEDWVILIYMPNAGVTGLIDVDNILVSHNLMKQATWDIV